MRTFIAYGSTDVSPHQLKSFLTAVCDALVEKGIDVYCTTLDVNYDPYAVTKREHLLGHSLPIIDACNFLFALQPTNGKSEGMLIEVGYCLKADIPILVATSPEARDTYLPELGTVAWQWNNLPDLLEQIKATDFTTLFAQSSKGGSD